MIIKPLNDYVIIICEEISEKTTDSGIIVIGKAANDKTKPIMAIVTGIGPDVTHDISVGDVVLWDRSAKIATENAIIVHESTLLAVIDT